MLGSSNCISKDTSFPEIGGRPVMVFVTVAVDINSSFTGNSPEVLDFRL